MKKFIISALAALVCMSALAQVDRHDVRAGNRKYRKGDFKEAEIDYRKAVVKDSMSMAGGYNLASTLYRQEDYEGAGKALSSLEQIAPATEHGASYFYNLGDIALQKKDYKAAVEAFRKSLLISPGDLDAKENYIYAKKMLDNQDQDGGGGQDNQDQNQDQNNQDQNNQNNDQNQDNQDQNKDQNQGQNQPQDQGQNPDQGQQPQESRISPQQAQQMIQAIQAKEKETQDKVNKEKAALLKSKQKEKNW